VQAQRSSGAEFQRSQGYRMRAGLGGRNVY
jgi:hypothetical protein